MLWCAVQSRIKLTCVCVCGPYRQSTLFSRSISQMLLCERPQWWQPLVACVCVRVWRSNLPQRGLGVCKGSRWHSAVLLSSQTDVCLGLHPPLVFSSLQTRSLSRPPLRITDAALLSLFHPLLCYLPAICSPVVFASWFRLQYVCHVGHRQAWRYDCGLLMLFMNLLSERGIRNKKKKLWTSSRLLKLQFVMFQLCISIKRRCVVMGN